MIILETNMKVKVLKKDVKLPMKSHLPDVGLDIFLPEDISFKPFETKTIGLGLAVAIPEGFAGILVPRSSIAQTGLIIQPAIIDPDYVAEIHLIATNCSNNTQSFEKGQRLCSLVMINALNAYIELTDTLTSTTRGEKGLGSTGK